MVAVLSIKVEEGSGPRLVELPFSEKEFQRRLDGIRSRMRDRALDAFITFTPENLYYINAHDTPGYYWYQACIITHDRPPVTVVRLVESGATLAMGWSRRAVIYGDRDDPVAATFGLLQELGIADKTIGMEADAWFISPRRYQALTSAIESAGGTVSDASGLVESMRATKSPEELVYSRAGGKVVVRAMAAAIASSHEGANENEVAAATVAEMIRAGGEYAGLPPFIASGLRASICHVTWSGRTYEKGDVLSYELPGVVKRYCAALFRCGTIGPPTDEIRRRGEAITEALNAVIEAIRPGETFENVNLVHRRVFAKHGYEHMIKFQTAYSLGINYPPDWGENHIVRIQANDQRVLEVGMVFHVGIAMYDLGHSALETTETVAVSETGCEVLTETTEFARGFFVA